MFPAVGAHPPLASTRVPACVLALGGGTQPRKMGKINPLYTCRIPAAWRELEGWRAGGLGDWGSPDGEGRGGGKPQAGMLSLLGWGRPSMTRLLMGRREGGCLPLSILTESLLYARCLCALVSRWYDRVSVPDVTRGLLLLLSSARCQDSLFSHSNPGCSYYLPFYRWGN